MRAASRVALVALLSLCLAATCEGASRRRALVQENTAATGTGASANGSNAVPAETTVIYINR